MNRDAAIAAVIGAFVLITVLVVVGAFATTTSTTIGQGAARPIPDPPGDSSAGVVFDMRTSGGRSILGLELRSRTREAHIGIVVPPECVRKNDSATEELVREGKCLNLPAIGELSGGGTTAAGLKVVFVRVEVPERCYDVLSIGDDWPPTQEDCAVE